ncbi:protein SINE1-like isoform X1 [Salvia splendens]|uniref:protein SINE1-like isoform X1 n=1 Tax=Salvia splendens TaxID=180675 RepID=UPI001104009E|nr:protein SINE1-like isoform X1 [Salvia splendens]
MGRSLSPVLRRELENLDKDADSRKSAMKALKLYVKDLDSKAIPIFLAQVSETKETGMSSGEHTISLYEVLARVHGPKIVPQIDNIMNTIVKTLSLSAGAFALHQACSKVVPAIARYAIDPTTIEERKRHVIHSLCKPLSDCLLGSLENLSSGAALCLQSLIESDNWRFASNEMINEVCQRVAGALEKHSQTNSHMALVTALAKHNSLVVEAYGRLLVQSGLRILEAGFVEENSQKRKSAIHMVSSLLRYLDPKSIAPELELVIKEMENCQYDRMPFVSGAAFEVLQNAKKICNERCSKSEREFGSATGSNFGRRENMRMRRVYSSEALTASPESQTVDSFVGYDYLMESPNSINHGPQDQDYSSKGVNRRLWRRCENGFLDVSLKDGIFSDIAREESVYDEISGNHGEYCENFAAFVRESAKEEVIESNAPSPQQSKAHIKVDDVKIFSTPRRLIRSLQDLDNSDVGLSEKQPRRFRSPMRPVSLLGQLGLPNGMDCENKDELASGDEQFLANAESVSSTEDVPNLAEMIPVDKPQVKKHHNSAKKVVFAFFVGLFAVLVFLLVIGDQDNHHVMVPT